MLNTAANLLPTEQFKYSCGLGRFTSNIGFDLEVFCPRIWTISDLCLRSEKRTTRQPALLFPPPYFSYSGAATDLRSNYVLPFPHSTISGRFLLRTVFLFAPLFFSLSHYSICVCLSLSVDYIFSSLFPALLHLPLDYADVTGPNERLSTSCAGGRRWWGVGGVTERHQCYGVAKQHEQ